MSSASSKSNFSTLKSLREATNLRMSTATNYSTCSPPKKDLKGFLGAVYVDKTTQNLSPLMKRFDEKVNGELSKKLSLGPPLKSGSSRIFWGIGDYPVVALVGVGTNVTNCPNEMMDKFRENRRIAAGVGLKALKAEKVTEVEIDDMEDPQSVAEGAFLANYTFNLYKTKEKQPDISKIALANSCESPEWTTGAVFAEAQNWARQLAEMPANLLNPGILANKIKDELTPLNVCVQIHDRVWLESMKMGALLSVARGSSHDPFLLELDWKGGSDSDDFICLVGKGVTFDSGGISIKTANKMGEMRGDMQGAAIVCAAMKAVATLNLPMNVKVLVPLVENMPGPTATRPGDVVFARNGKSICVDNTDAEGRLILADALIYASEFDPDIILDVATLTGAMSVALGPVATGTFVNNEELWSRLQQASYTSGDRLWRFPLFSYYKEMLKKQTGFDLNNIGPVGAGGGSCTAAAFLSEFVSPNIPWAHLDMASVMINTEDQKYLSKGMTGRPLRTILELIVQKPAEDKC